MGAPKITLHDYGAAEREIARESSTVGLMVHGIVTMLVGAVLIVCDVVLAPELPWAALAVGSMLVGLLAHWWFGYIKVDDRLTRQQQMVEARAARMR